VEALNRAVKTMLFAGLPRFTEGPQLAGGKPADPDAPALRFEAFVAELLAWVSWWNTRYEMDELGRTPLQAWRDDPTPLATVPAEDLRLFMLEDDGKVRTITNKGVQWRAGHTWRRG
jgi:putative transposase